MGAQSTAALVVFLMAIIVMMILPVPSFVLDLGLAFSFGIAITIFTVTLFIERPLDFSAFPSILLGSLMLRLSLNVSSTKLILSEGHTGTSAAGSVIEGFASFIMGGSLLLGIITFCVILIVNFMVITKGAARMAEVGARFALDGMPGRQLAIDSDVAAGAISHEEAKVRRATEQAEASFLGSLDGASKFVKGDAIAGLLITLLNIVAGLLVGTLVHGLTVGDAFEVYAILTIGDGLVTQIPAVVISVASGLLLARSGLTDRTDTALGRQIGRFPEALLLVAGIMTVFAVFPGMPFLPFFALAVGATALYFVNRARQEPDGEVEDPSDASQADNEPKLVDLLDVDEIHLSIAPNLIGQVLDPISGLEARVDGLRRHIATDFGVVLPEVRITDDPALPPGRYVLRIQGVKVASAEAMVHHYLVLTDDQDMSIKGQVPVQEPVFGASALWVPKSTRAEVEKLGHGVISPIEMISTHLLEVIKNNLSQLLTMRALNDILNRITEISDTVRAAENRNLIAETIPERISKEVLLSILRMLLEEGVSIKNLPRIIEITAEAAQYEKSSDAILEKVRQAMSMQILEKVKSENGELSLLQLDREWEDIFLKYSSAGSGFPTVALPPDLFQSLVDAAVEKVKTISEKGLPIVFVTSQVRRRFLYSILKSKDIQADVVSYEELRGEKNMSLVGLVAAPSQ
ncbi:flagellar biosynthesis protein FlhA [Tropicimonas sp. S265A]|uniref:flagellar biosynthesis protein FlhA n=1 Tax=Tropicimonas sp. S265A TaxID=3415134 RepID=UPI003C79E45A